MSQKRVDSWKNAERHYCAYCNVWMGSDRQSILIHENGKKHREQKELGLQKLRDNKLKEEKDAKALEKSLKMMEEAANAKMGTGVGVGVGVGNLQSQSCIPVPGSNKNGADGKGELKSWQDRKEKRKMAKGDGQDDESIRDKQQQQQQQQPKRRKLELRPDEGHYQMNSKTYLEGGIYASIFEDDMPIQIWTGSTTMTAEYRKTDEAQTLWKTGIIIRVHKKPNLQNLNEEEIIDASSILCDISYLKNDTDEDETIENKVVAERLRLILGSDDLIPSTIEEARLCLMGGEEIISVEDPAAEAPIDENTGLSGWGTVSIRKVTVSQEVKEERARARAKRRAEMEKEKMKEREMEARRMEDAKHSNADDSALGAYDIWSTSGKAGYKGMKIQEDVKVDAVDSAKSLAKGRTNVKFKAAGGKKSMFKKAKKKQNRRKTFADDDE